MAQGVGSGKIEAPQPNAEPVAQDQKGQPISKSKNGEKQNRADSSQQSASKAIRNSKEREAAVRGSNRKAELRADKKGRKKKTARNEALPDEPPPLKDCEWSVTETGWNLLHLRAKKKRYSGHLGRESWEVMKEYDYQAYFKQVEERLCGHGGR